MYSKFSFVEQQQHSCIGVPERVNVARCLLKRVSGDGGALCKLGLPNRGSMIRSSLETTVSYGGGGPLRSVINGGVADGELSGAGAKSKNYIDAHRVGAQVEKLGYNLMVRS